MLRAGMLCLVFVAGCTEYNDLYKKYGLDETRLILLVRYPQYLDTRIDLRKTPPGTGFLFGGPKRDFILAELTEALRVNRPPEVKPAYALVFFPEDDVAQKTVVLDQYLNLLPGFRFLGQDYAGPYCEGPLEFRKLLLRAIWNSTSCQNYHVALLRRGGGIESTKRD